MDKHFMLKKAYGLENLCFYRKNNTKIINCCYGNKEDNIDINELDFVLKALSMQQYNIFFDDIGQFCVGIDELKHKYLIFKLSGL